MTPGALGGANELLDAISSTDGGALLNTSFADIPFLPLTAPGGGRLNGSAGGAENPNGSAVCPDGESKRLSGTLLNKGVVGLGVLFEVTALTTCFFL